MRRRVSGRRWIGLLGLPAALTAAPLAVADTQVTPDPTAANVSALGSVAAWSRRADDGSYRLVLRENGAIVDAPVRPSPHPFDPDIGTNADGSLAIVYARCTGPGKDSGCDIYRFDFSTRSDSRVAVSTAGSSETAPSYERGVLAFVRSGTAKTRGVYFNRPGSRPLRVAEQLATETDLHATQVVFAYRKGGRSYIRAVNRAGLRNRIVARGRLDASGAGDVVGSPQLTRYYFYWVRVTPQAATAVVQRSGSRSNRSRAPVTGDRTLPNVTSMSADRTPVLYASVGIQAIAPLLFFRSG